MFRGRFWIPGGSTNEGLSRPWYRRDLRRSYHTLRYQTPHLTPILQRLPPGCVAAPFRSHLFKVHLPTLPAPPGGGRPPGDPLGYIPAEGAPTDDFGPPPLLLQYGTRPLPGPFRTPRPDPYKAPTGQNPTRSPYAPWVNLGGLKTGLGWLQGGAGGSFGGPRGLAILRNPTSRGGP